MKPVDDVSKMEVYAIRRANPFENGSITICTNGCNPGETRLVGDLEAVLVIDPNPMPHINSRRYGKSGEPIRVIGIREFDSFEPLSVWEKGFVHHPEHGYLHTSPYASEFISYEAYCQIMGEIKTGDDVIELMRIINKYFNGDRK